MNNKILVAHASKYGATTEIAEKISEEMKAACYEVDTLAAKSVKDLSAYQAVILGVAMYMGQWQKDAVNLVKTHKAALSSRPVYIFISGPTGEGDPVEQLQGRLSPENLKGVLDSIHPKEITVFGGKVDDSKLNGFEKWIMKQVKAPSGDFRNWQAISAWTAKVSAALRTIA